MSEMPKSQSNKGLPLKGDGGAVVMYSTPSWVTAFTTGKGCGVEALGLRLEDLALPRQVHSDNVLWMREAGRPEATDAVITDKPGLCVCVKTADCIPVLLYDTRQRIVAAVHAGWRGTVSRIVQKTVEKMHPINPQDLHAIIGPGISLEWFEVGNEVYEAFRSAGFPMERIARKGLSKGGLLSSSFNGESERAVGVFSIFHKCLVHEAVATWSGITSGEVPVALVLRAGGVQTFDCLKDKLYRCLHSCGTKHLGHLSVDVFYTKRLVDGADTIPLFCCWLAEFGKTSLVCVCD